ncbi:MAG: glycosyltransferase [Candidatus Methylacidiphilales bacterium]|nr:glycosyltransferase [Candidatus Methylacidiphilales bacterium]
MSESSSIFRAAARLILDLSRKDRVAVFTRDDGFLPHLWRLARRPSIRGFYELHDYYADLSWREGSVPFRNRREQFMERVFLPRISGIVCICHEQEKLYQKTFPGIVSLSRPLGTKPFPDADPEAKRLQRTVVYVGHTQKFKGSTFMAQAAVALARRNIRTLFMGGYKENSEKLIGPAQKAGYGGMVESRAFLPPKEMHRILAERASVGVVMLPDTFYNRHLTCPVKALDYLSHGIPAFSTDLATTREVLGEAGIYLSDSDPEQFAGKVADLLDDRAGYARAVERMKARARDLQWVHRARDLVQFSTEAFGNGVR